MARTHKSERVYQAKLDAIAYKRKMLEAVEDLISRRELGRAITDSEILTLAALYGVRSDDIKDQRGLLW
jgi:hypothetical protein